MLSDHQYMIRALQLAERGVCTTHPNPSVGCVLVHDNDIVGEGWHERAGGPHAEIRALDQAGKRAAGATAYVTLEPCCHDGKTPPCTTALIDAGIIRVVLAMEDPNPLVAGKGTKALKEAGVAVGCGLLKEPAERINAGFIKRMLSQRPLVRVKLAMSLDGRTAMASGESKWITATEARHDVMRLRARSSAIITGIGTVMADDPSLTVRTEHYPELVALLGDDYQQPMRVILDPYLATPEHAKMFSLPGKTLIVTATSFDKEDIIRYTKQGVEVIHMPGEVDAVSLPRLLDYLAEREINDVLVETGATLSGAFVQAGLVDELWIYMAPKLMGNQARGLFHLPDLESMNDAISLKIKDLRAVGDDWRIIASLA
ncbi:MAG: bifunctional diaminohydroxyphosphoribosylaminopyrimidine deaminase/5-amino-6-(5-phosphoribosylamino)uracil reductase RibD [Gammaproteobacteria bacterium]|nr:MAG: bifunctional diaminohydroxyphosphoribosylaminopyrimidine deaminase/5-amino-6-(5-phosphoribosylamino)uracil reductase RibD [Gammaproteobacteria bacterium]